ncbi:hypothetical protein KUTeg_000567 [Tegillarca granosa]|uniref:Uncharacterized protein n=1 Tax=Tegillarca granosa TaxID=220873 RepID=A0ABQ9FZ97_TEGGR|nr:hypothetical protein KUTeg_000567 [Tegillarca granosa]
MALVTGLSPICSPTETLREYEITTVDDDIIETINKLFTFGQTGVMSQEAMEETIGKAVQAERNHWKAILKSSELEKESFHKIIRKNQDSLQRLMNSLKFSWRAPKKESSQLPETIQEDQALETDIVTENLATDSILKSLKFRVDQLKLLADKDKEIKWLQKEVSSAKNHAAKLDKIINNYNENHTGANFHLDGVELETDRSSSRKEKQTTVKKERTYIEGDPVTSLPSTQGGSSNVENVKNFSNQERIIIRHVDFIRKGREIKEHYDDSGKLVNVDYKWACCKNGLESRGCAYGFHV